MMRSLFAGVSGLRNHQIKMDVIGNNIANVNTVAFKAARVTFKEVLAQTLQDASRPSEIHEGRNTGGRNPMQVGLGMSLGSIDTVFSQGALEFTAQMTDLAIQGEGLFIVSDGTRSLYTRAGNFHLNGDGRLVSLNNHFIVQGKMADATGNVLSGTSVGDVVLPFGRKAPALATTEVTYQCNLDSDSDAKIEVWTMTSALTTFATVTGTAAPTTNTITAATNDQLKISVDGGTAETITIAAAAYADVDALITAINTTIAANASLNGEVTAANVGGKVSFRTTDAGSGASITLTEGNAGLANLNIAAGTTDAGGLAGTSDSLHTLGLIPGDTIQIGGTNPEGSAVSQTYTHADGDTVQDLLDAITAAFTGVTASLGEDGKIVLTDGTAGDSLTSISLSASASNTGTITLPGFSNTVAGRDAGTHSASIFVYDSLGDRHNVEITFTKSSISNTWDWTVTIDGGLISPTNGESGQVTFNNDGSLAAFMSSDNAPLRFSPGGGAESMSIALNGGRSGGFDGISQLASPSTTVASDQNGHSMGTLSDISIDSAGKITGAFTNGVSQTLAQIALATFNNPGGLLRSGDNMYETSGNSGQAVVGLAGTNVPSKIVAGSLEMSNVDLAKEFTDMIIAQRGFQANARVITTSDTLLDEITRLKR